MFLLDTNVLSELRKAQTGRANPAVTAWAVSVPNDVQFLSVIVIQELETGALLAARHDPAQGAALHGWLEGRILAEFAGRVLTVDLPVARQAAALHVPDPRPSRDALIAATALVHGLTVVTRNVADFRPTGVPVLNPWEPLPGR